jgi:site-specific DNA-cytosine methylase
VGTSGIQILHLRFALDIINYHLMVTMLGLNKSEPNWIQMAEHSHTNKTESTMLMVLFPALNQGKSDLIIKQEIGDSIGNPSNPNSETSRGRDGKQKAQTLETSCNQAVVQPVQIGQSSKTYAAQNGTLIGKDGQDAFTIRSSNPNGVNDGYRIRRLTPIECERLQGFPDDHTAFGNYDGEVKPMSNTQRYKQCGNAVTVDVVQAVAEQCKPLFK